jgi:LysR family glycine cleavage system transcriptional activator
MQTSMNTPRRRLPPLDYLLAFEAAAQSGSFAGAARQMYISESAISRKVRLLEEHLGLTLFGRGHRSVELTASGERFLAQITPALELVRTAVDDAIQSSLNRPVVLAATQSVASLWLTPRLPSFRNLHRDINITLMASDNDAECLSETVDLAILRGDGNWKGFDARLLFGEVVFPVCAPDFLLQHPQISQIAALADAPLIEVASHHPEWMNWQVWLQNMGQAAPKLDRATVFNSYPLSILAAADGVGIALGWGHLVDPLLASGRLVRPLGPLEIRTDFGYYLLTPQHHPAFANRSAVVDWLRDVS